MVRKYYNNGVVGQSLSQRRYASLRKAIFGKFNIDFALGFATMVSRWIESIFELQLTELDQMGEVIIADQ